MTPEGVPGSVGLSSAEAHISLLETSPTPLSPLERTPPRTPARVHRGNPRTSTKATQSEHEEQSPPMTCSIGTQVEAPTKSDTSTQTSQCNERSYTPPGTPPRHSRWGSRLYEDAAHAHVEGTCIATYADIDPSQGPINTHAYTLYIHTHCTYSHSYTYTHTIYIFTLICSHINADLYIYTHIKHCTYPINRFIWQNRLHSTPACEHAGRTSPIHARTSAPAIIYIYVVFIFRTRTTASKTN